MGSCQWCHHSYDYDSTGDINSTLNEYGREYQEFGKNSDAIRTIEAFDSDMDGYSNRDEIAALRFPGSSLDDPTKVPAPYRIVTLEELEMMSSHSRVMLMNTHKSGEFYAEYEGVTMANLNYLNACDFGKFIICKVSLCLLEVHNSLYVASYHEYLV